MVAAELRGLPNRDPNARALLRAAATRAAPAVHAGDRRLSIAGPIGDLIPAGGIRRGATIALDGPPGAGSTTVAMSFAAAATSAGEWAAVVDPAGTFGARAAADAGVELERCAVVRRVPPERWATVVAALLDGVALVVATTPNRLRLGDARRLIARARERQSVLVALGTWPAEASLRIHARAHRWSGLGDGVGLLTEGELVVECEGRGLRPRSTLEVARAG